jgi:hypothetical protein
MTLSSFFNYRQARDGSDSTGSMATNGDLVHAVVVSKGFVGEILSKDPLSSHRRSLKRPKS